MNIDRSLVARAFAKAGEEPIGEEEWTAGTSNRVRIVREFYLAILLEALSSYDWTSQKKRVRLTPIDDDEGEENLTDYNFMYPLPADCAKVVQIEGAKPYIVEGAFLFTDEADAILVYIRNYFTGKYEFEEVENPVETDLSKYYIKDESDNYVKAESWDAEETYYVIVENDYNFYDNPQLDPSLAAYFECRLAASIALKLTGGADKYQLLYNEAQIIANNAQKKSAEQAQNRTHGNEWWTHQLGLD